MWLPDSGDFQASLAGNGPRAIGRCRRNEASLSILALAARYATTFEISFNLDGGLHEFELFSVDQGLAGRL